MTEQQVRRQLQRRQVRKTIIDGQVLLRAIIDQVVIASPQHREANREEWLTQARELAARADELVSLLNGEEWDKLLTSDPGPG